MNLDSAIFYSNDILKAVAFYTNVIGLQVEYQQGEKYVSFLFANNTKFGIKKAADEREKPGHQTIILQTENIDETYKKLMQDNVTFYKHMKQESWGRTFSILDPDGNKIEFVERSW